VYLKHHWLQAGVLVCGILLAATTFSLHTAGSASSTVVILGRSELQSSIPSLTSAQVNSIEHVVGNDRRVHTLIHGHASQISSVVTWLGPTGVVIGGLVALRFNVPATVRGVWLSLASCWHSGIESYASMSYRATQTRVSGIDVLVQLASHSVVSLMPIGSSGLIGAVSVTALTRLASCDGLRTSST
jgi:hypothetical protein